MSKRAHIEETTNGKGESKTTKKFYNVRSKVPHFTMLFMEKESLEILLKVGKVIDYKLLLLMCEKAEFNTGVVELSAPLREEMQVKLGIDKSAFSQAKKRLVQLGLIDADRNRYVISDKVFWKGEAKKWEQRQPIPEPPPKGSPEDRITAFENEKPPQE